MNNFKPIIYDSTLREGMQTPGGIGGNIENRIYAAALISRFADWVELGMPANDVDYEIISKIKDSYLENNYDCGIGVLCRNTKFDIDRAQKVFKGYEKSLAHLFIGTSDEHRKERFDGTWDTVDYENNIRDSIEYASSKDFQRIMFSPEDSYRTFQKNPDDFFRFVDAAIEGYNSGSKKIGRLEKLILNFPDTVGYSTVSEFGEMLDKIIERYDNTIEISLHGHNDSSTSNSQAVEMFLSNKSNWLQTTFGMLGERNGIASTEGIIATLKSRGYFEKLSSDDISNLVPYTRAILASLGRSVPAEAVVSGYRTNVSTAGIHTQIAQKNEDTYHINGARFGVNPIMEFGPTSGAHQVIPILEKLNIAKSKSDSDVIEFTSMLKDKSNTLKRALSETDVMYDALHYFTDFKDPFFVNSYSVRFFKGGNSEVSIVGVYKETPFQKVKSDSGSIETLLESIDDIVSPDYKINLVDFSASVAPYIPEEYMDWLKGDFPKIPQDLDKHSKLKVQSAVSPSKNSTAKYVGFACGEDSFQSMLDSVIDAIVKMTAIEEYYKNM